MRRNLIIAGLTMLNLSAIIAAPKSSTAQRPAPMPPATGRLFLAITNGDNAAVTAQLKAGVDPNTRNWLGFTPLMWAEVRGQEGAVNELIARGARINDDSPYGSALTFALVGRHEKLALDLLARGAKPHPSRTDGATPLMYAAADGYPTVIKALLARHDAIDAKDTEGDTALNYSARYGKLDCVRTLLAAGANPNIADERGRTALMEAAANGRASIVAALAASHANVLARDKSGNSAMMLAARYCSDPAVAVALVRAGANPNAGDPHGATPVSVAARRGHTAVVTSLAEYSNTKAPVSISARDTRSSIASGLELIQHGMKSFAGMAGCNSCHHQGLGLTTLGMAADKGFRVDGALIGAYMHGLAEDGKAQGALTHTALMKPELSCMVQAVDIGDHAIGGGYLLGALIANHVPANPGFAEAALFLCKEQKPDGRWTYGMDREPMQGSQITTTALSLNVLKAYGDPTSSEVAMHVAKSKAWLLSLHPTDAEGSAMRLVGLALSGAEEADRMAASKELVALQHGDGGWSQLPTMPSDAYATGIAIHALRSAGNVAASDTTVAKGVKYLLQHQDEDGCVFRSI